MSVPAQLINKTKASIRKAFGDNVEFKRAVSKARIEFEGERQVLSVISSEIVDHDGDVVVLKGMDTSFFDENPVVLWSHGRGANPFVDGNMVPIGHNKWTKIKGNPKRLIALTQFDADPFSDLIFQKFKSGSLRSFSIGFAITESHQPTPDEIRKRPEWADAGRIITKSALFEYSAVAVPANPDAVALAVSKMHTKGLIPSDAFEDEFIEAAEERIFALLSPDDDPEPAKKGVPETPKITSKDAESPPEDDTHPPVEPKDNKAVDGNEPEMIVIARPPEMIVEPLMQIEKLTDPKKIIEEELDIYRGRMIEITD